MATWNPIRNLTAAAVAAALCLGCGQNPLAPEAEPLASSPAAAPAPPESEGAHDTVAPAGLLDELPAILADMQGLQVQTRFYFGSVGGTVKNGRFTLRVTPGAFTGLGAVVMGVADSASTECQLEIAPAAKNYFLVPVTLTADCKDVPDSELASYCVYWFDPMSQMWCPVGGSKVDLDAKTVSAPLKHFSKYSVGKKIGRSGW